MGCVHGARAVLKEAVKQHPQASVHLVWLPMVPGDDEAAARSTGRMFRKYSVHQYYDADRRVGLAYRDTFANCAAEALSVMPKDHPMYADLEAWSQSSDDRLHVVWDAVLFYAPGVEWAGSAPQPTAWSKQVGFFGADAGEVTGVFFQNNCRKLPVDSRLAPSGARRYGGSFPYRQTPMIMRGCLIDSQPFQACERRRS